MALPPDRGYVPLPVSYLPKARIQEAHLGQNLDICRQQPTLDCTGVDYPREPFDADTPLGSPPFPQHTGAPAQLSSDQMPDSIAQLTFAASPPTFDNKLAVEQLAMSQYAADPTVAALTSVDMPDHYQHCYEPAMTSQHLHHHHGQRRNRYGVKPNLHRHETPAYDLDCDFVEHSHAGANRYAKIPYAKPDHGQEIVHGCEPSIEKNSGHRIECEHNRDPNKVWSDLIFKCLLEATGHTRQLKEIYEWMIMRTNKVKTSGWKNSVRYNLSMNKAFVKPNHAQERKKLGVWTLAPSAVISGTVESTSQNRKPRKEPKPVRKGAPAPQRANAGAKGGRATRDARARRQDKLRTRQMVLPLGQAFVPPPHRLQPYYSYPTPERVMTDIDAEDISAFGAPLVLTPPASTLSSQSTWQTPQPDTLTNSGLGQWNELDFTNMQQRLPPTSDSLTSSQSQHGFGDVSDVSLSAEPGCIFGGGDLDQQEVLTFSQVSQLRLEDGDDMKGVLQRSWDDYAASSGY